MCESVCHVTLCQGNLFCGAHCRCCPAGNPIWKHSAGNNPRPGTLVDSARAHAAAQRRAPWTEAPPGAMNGTLVVPVSRGEGGRCRMPRTAVVTPGGANPKGNGEASKMRVDDLIQRGRSQGHLSLSELRTAFEQAGIAPAEGRTILRELAEAGIQMANEPAKGKRTVKDPTAKAGAAKVTRRAKTGSTATQNDADTESAPQASTAQGAIEVDDDAIDAQAERGALGEAGRKFAEADLDDQGPAMGDSVHTYLKSIGRTSLLTAEQEGDLAKRIEAGLFAEHKLE